MKKEKKIKDTIPIVTDEYLVDTFSKNFFDRGLKYFKDDIIEGVFCHGRTLYGICYGTQPNAYKITCTFDETKIKEWNCTCPAMEDYGSCKHIVALIICWLRTPEIFERRSDWRCLLDNKSKKDLYNILLYVCSISYECAQQVHMLLKNTNNF